MSKPAQSTPLLDSYQDDPHNETYNISLDTASVDHDNLNEKTILYRRPTIKEYATAIFGFLTSYLIWLLPRYLRHLCIGGPRREYKIHATSYLDALRGLAAWGVVNHHGFPYKNTWIMQLPCVRASFHGKAMVDIFFVISGYVLSQRLLKFVRNRDATALLDSSASASFRRYLRLFGSATFASFITMVLLRFNHGYYGQTPVTNTFFNEVGIWIQDTIAFGNPFAHLIGVHHFGGFTNRYLDSLWTIPVEYRGSMVVYMFCIMACKLSTKLRMGLCCAIIFMCYCWSAFYIALFMMGLLLADVSYERYPERLGTPLLVQQEFNQKSRYRVLAERCATVLALIFGLYLLGGPTKDWQPGAWPYTLLVKWIPSYADKEIASHFWLTFGAFLVVGSLDSWPVLQTPLTWTFPQYLGELSFGIYIVHNMLLWTLYNRALMSFQNAYLGTGYWAHLPPLLIYWLAILWAAELFTRIDNKVVAFGRWMQKKIFLW